MAILTYNHVKWDMDCMFIGHLRVLTDSKPGLLWSKFERTDLALIGACPASTGALLVGYGQRAK